MSRDDSRDWLAIAADGEDYQRSLEDGIEGLRIAWSPTLGYAKVHPEVARLAAAAAQSFAELGADVVEQVDAPFPDPTHAFLVHFATGLAHSLRGFDERERALLDPEMLAMIERAGPLTLERFLAANDERVALGRTMRAFHGTYDLLLTPTLAVPPFDAGRISPVGWDPEDWTSWTPFTYPFNLTGQPAATVCCGFTQDGLPVGLQIVGPLRGDALVLRAARTYERAHSPLSHRRPLS